VIHHPGQSSGDSSTGERSAVVAILGAGPAGAACAAHLGRLGVKGVVLVDRHGFPRDKTCGSGISPAGIRTLQDLGAWDAIAPHAYRIGGLRLVTPGGREVWASGGKKAEAVVCERRVLDHALVRHAVDSGAELLAGFHATSIIEEDGRVQGLRSGDAGEVRARFVVIAGGAHCRLGLPERRPRQTVQTIMGWWRGVPFRPNHVEMIFDDALRPYYGWLFPEGPDRVNIGIAYQDAPGMPRRNARAHFRTFLDKHFRERLADAEERRGWAGHPIVWSDRVDRLTRPGALIAGESGLMTNPATGEGIHQAMRSGILAAEAIRDVVVGCQPEPSALAGYERACQRSFRASFLAGRAFLQLMRTDALDWVVRAGQAPLVRALAAKFFAAG
jgi:geranylgeranyl reductase family protein